MRRSLVCPKCGHNHVLLVAAVADTGECSSDVRPLCVAVIKPQKGEGWLAAEERRAGQLGAAVCRACGYTELYTADPAAIPVDGVHVREGVGPEPRGPHR